MIRARLIRGVGANALAQLSNLAVQLISVPIYLAHWHIGVYGVWVVLFTLPGYVALLDLGFSTTAANDMTLAVAAGDRRAALHTYRSLWAGLCFMCGAGFVAVVLVALAVPDHVLPGHGTVAPSSVRVAVVLLSLYAFLSLQGSAVLAGLRAAGLYPQGVNFMTAAMLVEAALSLLVVINGGGVALNAAVLAGVRGFSVAAMYVFLRHRASWLSLSLRDARWTEIRRLLPTALASIAIPIGFAITLQGMVLAVALSASAVAAATYAVVRTLSRVSFQFAAGVSNAVMPEFTMAVGRRDEGGMTRLFVVNLVAAVVILVPAVVILGFFGPVIVRLWTGGTMNPSHLLVGGVAAAMCLHGFWHLLGNLLLAINRHRGYAYYYPVVSFLGVVLAGLMVRRFGLGAVVAPAILLEAVMFAIVWREYGRAVHLSWRSTRDAAVSLVQTARLRSIFGA